MAEVLLVMRGRGNARVLGAALGGEGYAVRGATDAAELARELARPAPPAVALVDVSGYRGEVWAMCEALRRRGVPFLVLDDPRRRGFADRGLAHGAASVLPKPLAKPSLLRLVGGLAGR